MFPKLLLAASAASVLALPTAVVRAPAALQEEPVPTVRESDTGVEFPTVRTAVGPDAETPGAPQHLAGVAVRDKTVFSVNVYAYALYVDPWAAQARLGEFDEASAKQLGKDNVFFDALMAPEIEKTLRLVFVRNVSAEDVVEAFEGSLEPRIVHARDELELPDATADLVAFKALFDLDKLRKGNELSFSWVGGDTLRTTINGVVQPELVSPGLCWALFDVYLGRKPIEAAGRKKIVARIPGILDAQLPPKPAAPRDAGSGR